MKPQSNAKSSAAQTASILPSAMTRKHSGKWRLLPVLLFALASYSVSGANWDLSRDFSGSNNPNGPWSFGAMPALTGPFSLFTVHGTVHMDNGVPIQYWQLVPGAEPTINHNATTNTGISSGGAFGGQFVYPPGTVGLFAGTDGFPNGFGVVRFTVPASQDGVYKIETSALHIADDVTIGDTDYHVIKNGVELFGEYLRPDGATSYSNELALAAGDRIDFVVGRGADGSGHMSGLKLQVAISGQTSPPPLPTFDVSTDFSTNLNPAGVWSYGWKSNFDGAFNLFAFHRRISVTSDPPGGWVDMWSRFYNDQSALWCNTSTTTVYATSQGVYPPGTVLMVPGVNGNDDSFCALRFIAPTSGTYLISSAVQNIYHGSLSGDTDFHVVKNGIELFGQFIPPDTATNYQYGGYTNELHLSAGDQINFLVGRGADGNMSGSGLTIKAVISLLQVDPGALATYDLSNDFSTNANPAGVWSYGWKSNFTGNFNIYTFYRRVLDPVSPPGAFFDVWARFVNDCSQVQHNGTDLTARSGDGGVYPPGTTLLVPGNNGRDDNFAVFRFTAPAAGQYLISSIVENAITGPLCGDSDYHVLHNGVELFGAQIPAAPGTNANIAGYTNTVDLAFGDTIEFLGGRGLDGRLQGSNLKIKAMISLITLPTLPVYDISNDFSTNANPAGVWSYGWKSNFTGNFNIYTFYRRVLDPVSPPGAFFDVWARFANDCSQVQHNGTDLTARSGDGGVYPPGTTLLVPGNDGRDDNFAVFRFTAPAAGEYLISSAVENAITGIYCGDTEYHVLKNGVELFGAQIPVATGADPNRSGYTNNVTLAVGDTIEFFGGRGLDGLLRGSNLKIKGSITLISATLVPPTITLQPEDKTVFAGQDLVFNVQANGPPPLHYQWRLNGSNILGATGSSLLLNNVQPDKAGMYSVQVSNDYGSILSSNAQLTVIPALAVHDIGEDFSTNANPAGVWSYGWKSNFTGNFNLYTYYRRVLDPVSPPGAFFDVWARFANDCSQVQHNGTDLTARSGDGGVYPPGTTLLVPGNDGRDDQFAVFRFTAPIAGQYLISSEVENAITGPNCGDSDYHVLHNGLELYGVEIPAATGTNANKAGYTNNVSLRIGDTIEFLGGRGLDGLLRGSNLKIQGTIALLSITSNQPPVADPQSLSVNEDASLAITLTGSDPDGDPLTFAISAAPLHGSLGGAPPNLVYQPNANYNGPDQFAFTVSDGSASSDPATVSITVLPVNDPPVAYPQTVTLNEDTPTAISLGASDVDHDPLNYEVTPPAHGTLSGVPPTLTYTPTLNYNGADSFTFRVHDGTVWSDFATVALTIVGVNDPPVAFADVFSPTMLRSNATNIIIVSPNNTDAEVILDGSRCTDPENDPLAWYWWEEGATNTFAEGVRVTNVMTLGAHIIYLGVTDGQAVATNQIELEIITAAEAATELFLEVNDASISRNIKRPLLAMLRDIIREFERGRWNPGLNHLQNFQHKVQQHLARTDPALAEHWINQAQDLLDALQGLGHKPRH